MTALEASRTTKLNLTIPQGSVYRFVVTVVGGPDDMTGFAGWMQIRDTKASDVVLDELTTEITVNHTTRQVVVTIPDTVTELYAWDNAVYDLVIIGPDDERWRVVEGYVHVNHSVTRED